LILALKHSYPGIDDFLVNELAFIPGISPDELVDTDNTTAIVDYRTAAEGGTHTIKGTPAPSETTFSKTFDSNEEFSEGTLDNTVVFGETVLLTTTENSVFVDDFENVSDWDSFVSDLSAVSPSFDIDTGNTAVGDSSGKIDISSGDVEVVYILSKTFDAQDWTSYDKLIFQLFSESADHGDIFFFVEDSVAGTQNSFQIVLERNTPTINRETGDVGFREIAIDLTPYTRTNMTKVGFYTSTEAGWDPNVPLVLNIDDMFVTSGNIFVDSGTANYIFGNDILKTFSTLRWDAFVPDGTVIKARTRVADSESSLSSAAYSSFLLTSGSTIELPAGEPQKFIEVEMTFEADDTNKKSSQLFKLFIDMVMTAEDFSFDFETQEAWESGSTLSNIDTTTDPGSISIKSVGDLGTFLFGKEGSVKQLNSDFSDKLEVFGSGMPKSFIQLSEDTAAGFGQISSVDLGLDDTWIVADTDNDRILEIDKSGNLIWGLMGTQGEDPVNPYIGTDIDKTSSLQAIEIDGETTTTTETTTAAGETAEDTLDAVGCYYNVNSNLLSIMFDDLLENIYSSSTFDISNIVLRAATKRIFLSKDNATATLFGADSEHIALSPTDSDKFLTSSNVLQIQLAEADAVTLNNVISIQDPYLTLVSPSLNIITTSSSVAFEFLPVNCTLSTSDCGVRVVLDTEAPVDLYTTPSVTFTGISDGLHSVQANLIDKNGNAFSTPGTEIIIKFVKTTGAYGDPAVTILSPTTNDVLDGGSATVSFETDNVPAGHDLYYTVDAGSPVKYTGTSPLTISPLANGAHDLRFYIGDSSGTPLVGDITDVTFEIVMGNRINIDFDVFIGANTIQNLDGVANSEAIVTVDVNNMHFANINSPVDLRLVQSDKSVGDATQFTYLVAKVGTKSYLNTFVSDETASYLDGHTVVEFDRSGNVVTSNIDALIVRSRDEAKSLLGSVEKGGPDELLIGDAVNRRAIIADLDTSSKTSQIVWEFNSDKIISDFSRIPLETTTFEIDENGLNKDSVFIKRDSSVIWRNNSSDTIRILSGSTTSSLFAEDPDLALFGFEFDSGDLAPGESFVFRFINFGTFNFFVYPDIFTGQVFVTNSSISPDDKFVLAENDASKSSYASRAIKIDAWGNLEWSFGETFVRFVKDVKPVSDTEIVVTV
jgi:hypothetical protein